MPEIVVREPPGSVDTEGDIVTTVLDEGNEDCPGELGLSVSVVAEIVVNEPFDSVETDAEIVLNDGSAEASTVPVLPGRRVIVKPSVVIVVGEETSGRERVSEPITIGEVGLTV